MAEVYLALLHYPVLNKSGAVVTTSVANMDIHDIARAARTYGVKRFYIVTPLAAQRQLAERIICLWQTGYGSQYNPSRKEAFDVTSLCEALDDVTGDIESRSGHAARLVATGAGLPGRRISYTDLRSHLDCDSGAWLLIFGTGSGLADQILKKADYLLEPIKGPEKYNHLSVRSAVAITLDRLLGK
jgi:hypothetical protein